MTNVTRVRIFGGVFALLLAFQTHADTLLGKVINVADGDTITVLGDTNTQHKIRLTGIDAPEKRKHSAMSPSRACARGAFWLDISASYAWALCSVVGRFN